MPGFLLLAFWLGTSHSANGQSCSNAPPGLVSWWRGEGDAADVLGGNQGVLTNTAYTNGQIGDCFTLPGTNSAVIVGPAANLNFTNQSFTIETWIRLTNASKMSQDSQGNGHIFGFGSGGYALVLNAHPSYFPASDTNSLMLTKIDVWEIDSMAQIKDTNWHHVAVAWDAPTGTAKFFLDSTNYSGNPGQSHTNFTFGYDAAIGARSDDLRNGFAGDIDELAVYTNELTQTQISNLWYAGTNHIGKCVTDVYVPCASAPSAMVSWWKGEGNMVDSWGYDPGYLMTNGWYTNGYVGTAFGFSGASSAVMIGNSNDLASGLSTAFSIEGWIQRASNSKISLDSQGNGHIFSWGTGGYGFVLNAHGITPNALMLTKIGYSEIDSDAVILDTGWHHVAVTKNGTNVEFYLDGTQYAASGPYDPGFYFNATTNAAIGARSDNLSNSFWGNIDEITVYNRQLSGTEISNIYAQGVSGKCGPIITNQPSSQSVAYSNSATFSVGVMASSPMDLSYQWQFDGVNISGATNSSYTVLHAMAQNLGTYSVVVSDQYSEIRSSTATLGILPAFVTGWGDNSFGELAAPLTITNPVAVAAGNNFSLALQKNGGIVCWGDDTYGQTNIPVSFSNAVSVVAAMYHGVALSSNGAVTNWGMYWTGSNSFPVNQSNNAPPPAAQNIISVASGAFHDLGLVKDGTVVAWGMTNLDTNVTTVPSGLSGVKAIACGWNHSVTLLANGTVTAWGDNLGSLGYNLLQIPPDLTNLTKNVTAIAAAGLHSLALKSDGTVEAWGYNSSGETNVPAGLSNVVAIAAGEFDSFALQSNGTVIAWGTNGGNSAAFPPTGISNVVALAARSGHTLALCGGSFVLQVPQIISANPSTQPSPWYGASRVGADGQYSSTLTLAVVATNQDESIYPISYQWFFNGSTNGIGLATSNYTVCGGEFAPLPSPAIEGSYTVWAIDSAGSNSAKWNVKMGLPGMIAAWGMDAHQEGDRSPLTNFIAVAAAEYHSLGLREDGTVTSWGEYWDGSFESLVPPPNNSNFVAVAAALQHDIGLFANGTVTNWGLVGEPGNWVPTNTPLTNISAIACGWYHNVALSNNGTVYAWETPLFGSVTNVPAGLTNATAIAAAADHSLALKGDGTVVAWGFDEGLTGNGPIDVPAGLSNVAAIATGYQHSLAVLSNGNVVAWGANGSGQTNVAPGLTNVIAVAAGWAHSVALKSDGTVISWGDNTYGETNVPTGLTNAIGRNIAAAGYHTIEALYSSGLQYPINIPRDLLLIYNTNSVDSSNMCMYYKNNRPMMSNAMVLGIDCTTNDNIAPSNFPASIQAPIRSWLSNNPTTRPDYVILFQDIPYNLSNPLNSADNGPSVQYQLHYLTTNGWRPHVTAINMNGPFSTNTLTRNISDGTVDTMAYINKVISMASNNPPGSLIISASAAGYKNTNWYFDGDHVFGYIAFANGAVQGVTNVNPTAAIIGTTNLATTATNVAGYYTAGLDATGDVFMFTNETVRFFGDSGWYIMTTIDSFDGDRNTSQANYSSWFAPNAFGGTNYANTPIGAVTTIDGPSTAGKVNPSAFYGDWAAGKSFGISAWDAQEQGNGSPGIDCFYFQAIGDPFVKR